MSMKKWGIFAKINRIDTFSPYFFMPFILILYFFTSIFDFHRYELFDLKKSILLPVIVGVVTYYVAVIIADKGKWKFPSFGFRFLKGKTTIFLYILGIIGLIAYCIMILTGQIGISDESVRRNLDPKLNFLSSFFWFAGLFLICNQITKEDNLTLKKKLVYGGMLVVLFIFFALMGYRTPILVMFFTAAIVFHYTIKRIKLTWFLSALFIIGLLFSLFGFYRIVTEDTSKSFNSRQGPDMSGESQEVIDKTLSIERKVNETPNWVRGLNSASVTGHIVLSKIMEYTDKHGYLNGRLNAATFGTILPGIQESPRMIVTDMVNSLSVKKGKYITRPDRTTTPTYLGQLYADGGYIAIIIGFAIFGFLTSMIYNQVKQSGMKSYQTIAYGFMTTIFTISMHTGLLDLVFVLMLLYVIVSSGIEKTNAKVLKNSL